MTSEEPEPTPELNRYIYCDHCQEMRDMAVIDVDERGRVIYRCPQFFCGEKIAVMVRHG